MPSDYWPTLRNARVNLIKRMQDGFAVAQRHI
jgi:hypothetical protein